MIGNIALTGHIAKEISYMPNFCTQNRGLHNDKKIPQNTSKNNIISNTSHQKIKKTIDKYIDWRYIIDTTYRMAIHRDAIKENFIR